MLITEYTNRELELVNLIECGAPLWLPDPDNTPQVLAYLSEANVLGYGGGAGGGKGLGISTLIVIPEGQTRIGDLQIGDEIFDENGSVCHVTGIFDNENLPCYKITFDDGVSIIADNVHKWLTFNASELKALTRRDPEWRAKRRANRPSRATGKRSALFTASITARNQNAPPPATAAPLGTVRTTQEIYETLLTPRGRRNHAIPLAKPLQLRPADLLVDPYCLGAWLGDGSKSDGTIAAHESDMPFMREQFENAGYETTSRSDPKTFGVLKFVWELKHLGIYKNKHIPLQYLRGSYEQRLALLQGLMDTDGTVAKNSGSAEFCNTNERIIDGMVDLICGLGWKASKREGRAKLNGEDYGPKWTLKWVASDYVFRMPRKRALQKLSERRTTQFRYVVACEPVVSEPTRCIAVDSPSHLYLVGKEMIVSHNSDLMIGKALNQHQKSMIMREEGTQMTAIIDRFGELLGTRDGYNGQEKIWRLTRRGQQVEFGSIPNIGDEQKYQGRPHDFFGIDEATNVFAKQFRFLKAWVRSTSAGQICESMLTFNPPVDAKGRWVIDFFAPWLLGDARPGELRYFVTSGQLDIEVPNKPCVLIKGEPVFDFDPKDYAKEDIYIPQSRTFIPARVADNKYLTREYMAELQALPEPLRSMMLKGDFMAGVEDSEWQVIPTAWVKAAMERWTDLPKKPVMDSIGVDVARGGRDNTIIIRRHGMWFDKVLAYPGKSTPDGPAVMGLIVANMRNDAPVHLDAVGVGSSPYDFLKIARFQVVGVVGGEKTSETTKEGRMGFVNVKSLLWWRAREAFDPANNTGIAIPPDEQLLKDLTAPIWSPVGRNIKVESREDIMKRIQRSPDWGSALVLALLRTPKIHEFLRDRQSKTGDYDPFRILEEL